MKKRKKGGGKGRGSECLCPVSYDERRKGKKKEGEEAANNLPFRCGEKGGGKKRVWERGRGKERVALPHILESV